MIEAICNYAGVLLAVLSITATAYFARKYSEKKLPRFCTATERKIAKPKDAPGDISVSYKGQPVDRVSSTVIWFWIAGRKPMRREDLPSTQPLEIQLADGDESIEILDILVRKVSRQPIGFATTKSGPQAISVTFDFMDQNDGAAIEVLHTGSIETNAIFSGIILGAPKGVQEIREAAISRAFSLPYSRRRFARSHPSLSFRIIFSIIITVILGGMAWLTFLTFQGEITTTTDLLVAHLRPFVTERELGAAVSAVVSHSKYRTLNIVMPYVMSGILFLNLVFGYLMVWRSPFSFPASLSLYATSKEKRTQVNDAGGETEQSLGGDSENRAPQG